jgi:hypothetical protein
MSWNLTITAQTLTCMVSFNALRCAKVVLEGRAPELFGMHANPNCVTKYGYFPLHEAAERFSVEMIKLLLRFGASANVRTVGDDVIEDLLPLHIAIENTCLHKYLEDNLSPSQNHLDYIYKLIHLLCLPEMVCFTSLPMQVLLLQHDINSNCGHTIDPRQLLLRISDIKD